MGRVSAIQTNFTAGELSPRLEGRVDFAKYFNGVRVMQNMIVMPHGGAIRRSGFRFVAPAKDSTKTIRLLPFEFSTIQPYVIEAGEGYFRFFRDEGQVFVAATDASIANGTFTSNITDWDDRSTGTGAISHDATNGRLNLDGAASSIAWAEQDVVTTDTGQEHVLRFQVVGVAGDSVALRVGATSTGAEIKPDQDYGTGYHTVAFTPTVSPFYVQFRNAAAKTIRIDEVSLIDDAPAELQAPYQESELSTIKRAQSADVLYLCQVDRPTHKLERFGHTSWSLVQVDFFDGPWLAQNSDTAKTLAPSHTSGFSRTVTASGHAPFAAEDVGRLIRIKHGTTWGHSVVTGFISTSQITVDVRSDFGGTAAVSDWQLGLWSERTGYPVSVTFFEERLLFGGTRDHPQRIDGSVSGDFENFTPGTEDGDAISFTLAADQVNSIRWLNAGTSLLCGTVGGEWEMRSNGRDEPVTPTNVNVKRHSTYGSADMQPLRVGNAILFCQRSLRKVRELVFSFEDDGFVAPDLTLLAEHVAGSGLIDAAYAQEPDSVLWCARADGVLVGMTYERAQDVVGWHCHPVGGKGVVEAVAVIPASGADHDQLWISVQRTINGATVRYVEFMEDPFRADLAPTDLFFVDSGLTYEGSPTIGITGLDHLEGEVVDILADGAVHPAKPVIGGQVTLDYPAATVQAGLGYVSKIETMRIEAGSPDGTAQGKTKRIHAVVLRFWRSLGVKVGPSSDKLDVLPFRSSADPMGEPPPLFTGDKKVRFRGGYSREGRMVIQQDQPLPLTVIALIPQLSTFDA